jgi:hypothetical protein
MTTNIILSLGQIAKSNEAKTLDSFASLLQEESKLPSFLAYATVYYVRAIDYLYYHTLDKYNKGEIKTNEFRAKLANNLE